MRKVLSYLPWLAIMAVLVLLDQWTKWLAICRLKGGQDVIIVDGVLQFRYLENTGAAFSILEGKSVVFFVLTPVLCLLVLYVFMKAPCGRRFFPVRVCCIFLLAGAIGNFIDRIRLGFVTDFIYVSLINFPVFNVADMYVTCSMAVLIMFFAFVYKDEELEWLFHK